MIIIFVFSILRLNIWDFEQNLIGKVIKIAFYMSGRTFSPDKFSAETPQLTQPGLQTSEKKVYILIFLS